MMPADLALVARIVLRALVVLLGMAAPARPVSESARRSPTNASC
jgi:hypothetical protein